MGLLGKLGNAVGDAASFAVPAGLTLGMGALTSGGTIGLPAILAALGSGSKGFAANEQEERLRKMMLRQQKNDATANLVNTLSPTARFNAKQAAAPGPGILEQGAKAAGMGIDAYNMAQQAQQFAEDRELRNKLIGEQLGGIEAENAMKRRALGVAEGVDQANTSLALDQQKSNRLGRLIAGTAPGTDVGSAGRTMLREGERQPAFGGFKRPEDVLRETTTPQSGASRTGFKSVIDASAAERAAALQAQRDADIEEEQLGMERSRFLMDVREFNQKMKHLETRDPKEVAGLEDTLRDDFTQLTSDFRDVRDGYLRIQEVGREPSAAGDVALLFGFMKINDPGSTVREGEFATAEAAAGVPERIRNLYNRVLSGERLTEDQRADFLRQADNLFKAQESTYKGTYDEFSKIAQNRGLNIENIAVGASVPKRPVKEEPSDPAGEPETRFAPEELRSLNMAMALLAAGQPVQAESSSLTSGSRGILPLLAPLTKTSPGFRDSLYSNKSVFR